MYQVAKTFAIECLPPVNHSLHTKKVWTIFAKTIKVGRKRGKIREIEKVDLALLNECPVDGKAEGALKCRA